MCSIFWKDSNTYKTCEENINKFRDKNDARININVKFYFDTSIWLDFFENRNEPNIPKSEWAHKLIQKIKVKNWNIIYSDIILSEFNSIGYNQYQLREMFKPLRTILIFVYSTDKQRRKAKDLAVKRNIPKGDSLHALIARDNNAILVTLDKDFQKLNDIINPHTSKDLI